MISSIEIMQNADLNGPSPIWMTDECRRVLMAQTRNSESMLTMLRRFFSHH